MYTAGVRTSKKFVDFNQAKSILLLLESTTSELSTELLKLTDSLKSQGKSVTVLVYLPRQESINSGHSDIYLVGTNEQDFLQRPKAPVVQQLKEKSFDLLLDLTTLQYPFVEYLIMQANASCKCGVKKKGANIYDFAIERSTPPGISTNENSSQKYLENYNQLFFYLKSIQSKDY